MNQLILQAHWRVYCKKRIFIGFLWLMLEFLFWTEKALIKAVTWTSSWKVLTTPKNIISEKFGQEECISSIICIQMPLTFGRNSSTDCTKKSHSQEFGSIWTNHPTSEEINPSLSIIVSSKPSLSIKWQSMLTLNTTVLSVTKTHSLIRKFIHITVIPPLSQPLTSSKNMEDLSLSVEATVWVLEDMQVIGPATILPLGLSWDSRFQETFCTKFLVSKWSALIFVDSMVIQQNNCVLDGLNWAVCTLLPEIIIKTSPKIKNPTFSVIMY